MGADAYYRKENRRWPHLDKADAEPLEILACVNRWAAVWLRTPALRNPFRVCFTASKIGASWANEEGIRLALPCSWLTVAHEFAHLVDFRTRPKQRVRHDVAHSAIVDSLCVDLEKHRANKHAKKRAGQRTRNGRRNVGATGRDTPTGKANRVRTVRKPKRRQM